MLRTIPKDRHVHLWFGVNMPRRFVESHKRRAIVFGAIAKVDVSSRSKYNPHGSCVMELNVVAEGATE
jgi:hypothetical protein